MTNKIGRNAPCPCESGKKYKHCCGQMREQMPPSFPPEVLRMMKTHEAAEKIRTKQQGYGRGIISSESNGYRLVAVGKTMFWSKEWLVFPDFLMHHMKTVLNPYWGERESKNPDNAHPLFRWLRKSQDYKNDKCNLIGHIRSGPMIGFAACHIYLSYALYLIAHHDSIPKSLLKRLRDPKKFLPAYYETLAGAAFAVAGFEIRCEEIKKSSDPTPEFTVTSKTTKKSYKVEAKRKDGWVAPTDDINNPDFKEELVNYIRGKIYDASTKCLDNAIYWIELSLPTLTSKDVWLEIVKIVKTTLLDAEKTIKIKGKPAVPAYVIITNHTYLANEDIDGNPTFASLETFNMPDFIPQGHIEIENALSAYDRHRDIIWAFESLNILGNIPVRFDGMPEEFLDKDGRPIPSLKVGERCAYTDQNGSEQIGIIEQIVCDGDNDAWGLVADEKSKIQSIIKMPLTEEEKRASKRYGEAAIGNPDVSNRIEENDLFGLYNWLLKTQGNMGRQQCIQQLNGHPLLEEFKKLSLADLRIRVCREMVKNLYAMRSQNPTPPQKTPEPA